MTIWRIFNVNLIFAEQAVQEVKRAAVVEVQRALAVAVAESRANERLRSQRYLDSLQLNQHPRGNLHARPGPFVRIGDTRPSSVASTSTVMSNIDDSDKEAHLPNVLGSVSAYFQQFLTLIID